MFKLNPIGEALEAKFELHKERKALAKNCDENPKEADIHGNVDTFDHFE